MHINQEIFLQQPSEIEMGSYNSEIYFQIFLQALQRNINVSYKIQPQVYNDNIR